MKILVLTATLIAACLLADGAVLAQTTPDASKQPTQSLSHGDASKQAAQSLSHAAPTKQNAQSLSHADANGGTGLPKQQ
jgi:hypothetical protein